MEITGKIKIINSTQSFGANNFRKREFVVTDNSQYPQDILMEMVQDKCIILDNYNAGDQVKVSINIRGNSWVNPQGETKYFNSIQAWKIEKTGGNINEPVQQRPSNSYAPAEDYKDDDSSDLPF